MRWLAASACLFLILSLISIASAAPMAAGPQASAAEIRSARGASVTAVRRLSFSDVRALKPAADLQVDLAADYVRMTRPGRDEVLDFKLRRLLILSSTDRTFVNGSLYADVGFRAFEFQNRIEMATVMSAGGIKPKDAPMTLAKIQSQLGLTIPGTAATPIETTTDSDGTIHFRSESEEIARVRFSDKRLAAEEQKAFARFIRRGLILHPRVGDAIAGDGRVPASLWYIEHIGFDTAPRELSLTADTTAQLDYPLPADFEPKSMPFAAPHESLSDLFALMQSAAASRAGAGPRTIESYRGAINAAHQKKEPLHAAMLIMEAWLQFGRTVMVCPGDPVCAIFAEAAEDPQVKTLMTGLQYGGRDAAKGLPHLRSIDRKGLSNPYLLDIYIANDMGGDPAAVALFVSGIRGNPYMASFYKDFGDHWYRRYDTPHAWFFYDLGRAMPGAEIEMLKQIDSFEARLATDFPLFF